MATCEDYGREVHRRMQRLIRGGALGLLGLLALALLGGATGAAMLMTGCVGAGDTEVASSGDPEADQRAQMRVGKDGKDGKSTKGKPLYERIGGRETIAKLVDDFMERAIADPRVNFERQDVRTNMLGSRYKAWRPTEENVATLKQHMVDFLTLATGGPVEYNGREMTTVHKGMRITNNEFDAMVGDIKVSMDKLGIGTQEKKDLLAIIETTRKEVVEKQ